ncbi:uncharacterized protein C9orf85 homolog [Nilaparvata lugens]|uniref:uncharacterized protein C9orf85 homolog n=1 Tax=Nilaparvata lugens TaxID=108931 RepID=UPI000B999AC8|nr:uncharacterized protein C9orf85 homolog [Nilaparvata lugens]XP_039288498.1 uncharacterized protein C9orf85 homolog [Nilaparvata lugens]
MSLQKGNTNRTRPPKYQNKRAFKNNLHDTSHITKSINSLQITNVCEKCKGVIEWKIKYKKYKPLKNPSVCCKCLEKCVKHAYHTMCDPCSSKLSVCPKCATHMERSSGASDLVDKIDSVSKAEPSHIYLESASDDDSDDCFDDSD